MKLFHACLLKPFLLFFLLLSFVFSAKSQNSCPLNIRVTTEIGTCYNNCGIQIDLMDESGNPLDSNATDLSNFKYYSINLSSNDTSYSYLNRFTVSPGSYKVGVQAVCHYSYTDPDSTYIKLDVNQLATATSTYETPVLSMINNTAVSTTDYGTVPSMTCANTGRVQLKITGGTFPYYVQVCDSLENPIDTVVFDSASYSGTTLTQYDYKDYYTIEHLASGKYVFFVWDGCNYHLPKVWQTIDTADLPYISKVCWFNSPVTFADSNTFKFNVTVTMPNGFYGSFIPDVIEYRLIYPEINGISDTTVWKHLPNGSYSGSSTSITLYDTAFRAHSYCELHNQTIKLESRTILCEPNAKSFVYRVPALTGSYVKQEVVLMIDSVHTVNKEYDSCGYWYQRTTEYGYPKYAIHYEDKGYAPTTTCDYNYINHKQYYTYPLYWAYTDTLTHQVLKTDTISTISDYSYLDSADVVPIYGDYKATPYTIPVQRTLYDGKGCELYTRFDTLRYEMIVNTSGGTRYERYLYASYHYTNNDYCCADKRNLYLYEYNFPPMRYNGDCTIELTRSPENNKYNFTATYSQATGKWTIIRDSLSNLATINLGTDQINCYYKDYCLPSGQYDFRITIPSCTTYVRTIYADFPDTYTFETVEEPTYELVQNCTELTIKPTAGKYALTKTNNKDFGTGAYQPYASTSDLAARFQVISGPTGGFSSTPVAIGGQTRLTMPGTYVIKMYPADVPTSYCSPEIYYDTLVFSGGTVEYKYSLAYVCDSLSTIGYVRVKGKNGTAPYTYSLYSGPNLTGTLLGENSTGIFDNVPLHDGQHISVKIQDACMASFPVNFYVFDLQKTDKCWFSNGAKTMETCEGTNVDVHALGMEDEISYHWTGPNGFSDSTKDARALIPRGSESGWYKVTLSNTGCLLPISDSIFLTVNPAPSVNITDNATVCPGQSVTLTYTATGQGDVHYTVSREEQSVVTTQSYTNSNGLTYEPSSSGAFWVSEVSDDHCRYSIPEDTVRINLRNRIATACDVITIPDSICLDSNAMVYASSTLATPYLIHWYSDVEQNHPLKTDTITNATDQSEYAFVGLNRDTALYVTVSNDEYCETQNGTIMNWLAMNAGQTALRCGESIRFYDSGGSAEQYSKNENIIHTFTATDNQPIAITFTKFSTEESYDKVLVFTGNTTNEDSLLASFSGDMNSSLPDPVVSHSGTLTIWFLSNGATQAAGWEAIVSNNPTPAVARVEVTGPIQVSIDAVTPTPVHYNSDVTLLAIGTGGRNQQYLYVWETSTDNSTWTAYATETVDTSSQTFTHLTQSLHVRVSIKDMSANACDGTDTAFFYLPVSNIKLSLNLQVQQDYHCASTYTGTISVTNAGTGEADNVWVKTLLPDGGSYLGGATGMVDFGNMSGGETKTQTFAFQLSTTYATITPVATKAQIWTCNQGDSVVSVVYGDWDWTGNPRQVDEGMVISAVLPSFVAGAYHISTFNDTVCSLFDAQLEASSTIATPQYFIWFADNTMTTYLKTDTVTTAGERSAWTIPAIAVDQVAYVSVASDASCPVAGNLKPVSARVIEPNIGKYLTSTNDTVCNDYPATLTASSSLGYPQYFNWWKNDQTTLLKRDTVTTGVSTFLPEHQTQDSIYYISVYNDTTCPYLPAHYNLVIPKKHTEFLMTKDKADGTTLVSKNDTIGFFDDGGRYGNYSTANLTYHHTFTAAPGFQVQLALTDFNSENTYDWMKIYDGTSTSDPQLDYLNGNLTTQMPKTFTSTRGSLTIEWKSDYTMVRSGWAGTITPIEYIHNVLKESTVSVKDSIARTTITQKTSQCVAPYSYQGFHNIDVSAAGTYVIDSTFHSAEGCDSSVTLTLTVEPIPTLTCPNDITDTLEFGSCALTRNPEDLGTPSWADTLGWVVTYITNNAPTDSTYYEGDNVITWTITDECGNTTSCGQHVFVIFPECPDAVDYEGNIYHGIRIDCDCWTQRNLKSNKYSDGSDIPGVYNYYADQYPNVSDNVNTFGRLYDWTSAIKDTADNGLGHIQGICPAGWYLPSAEQYLALNSHGAAALKSPYYWIDGGGNNSTGFTSLPAGYYDGSLDRYLNLMGDAYYWSTTYTAGNAAAAAVTLHSHCSDVMTADTRDRLGYSIRCIKEKR